MAALNTKLKATTLLETLIALLVISASFATAMFIYMNVVRDNPSRLKLHAQLEINKLTKLNTDLMQAEEFNLGDIKITKTVTDYDNYVDLKLVTYSAFNTNGKLILVQKMIIKVNE